MFALEFRPLSSSEHQELAHLCQRFLQASPSDRAAGQEALVALCGFVGAPLSPQLCLSDDQLWRLHRLVWNYASAPRMLLSEILWLVKRLQ